MNTSPNPKRMHISSGLLLLFSLLPPGANYLYMGLIKRGVTTMIGFFTLVFLVASTTGPFQLLLIFAKIIYTLSVIFDGFNIRRRINYGEDVQDGVHDIIRVIFSNKKLTSIIVLVVLVLLVIHVIGIVASAINTIGAFIIIAVALWVLLKKRKS